MGIRMSEGECKLRQAGWKRGKVQQLEGENVYPAASNSKRTGVLDEEMRMLPWKHLGSEPNGGKEAQVRVHSSWSNCMRDVL